ncbi:MAG TPA: ribosome-associated translation inhibitor RaiA [Verrucomicrobiae bacterium]|nr:ribosome-associated translation inhibitor RaiA [Verrucomicrobiae bacterium]
MKLVITGRHIEITPALKSFTREKIAKLDRWVDEVMEVHAILVVEKHRHVAELVVHGRHLTLSARGASADMYASIGTCIDRLEKQARKKKEMHVAKRRRPAAGVEPAPAAEDRPVRRKAAKGARASAGDADSGAPRIVRSETFSKKPMSVEEAALQVREAGLEFVVFRNERTQEVNVIYRRKDGSFGLIEPER